MPCCWRRQPRSWTGAAQRMLDVGAGVGVVGLAVARRVADASRRSGGTRGRSSPSSRAATSSATALPTRVRVVVADVSRRLEDLPELEAEAGSFDHVLANPPYNAEGAGTVSVDALKAAANVMPGAHARPLGALHGRHGQARRHGYHHPSCRCAGRGPYGLGRPVRRNRRLPALSAGRQVGDPRARAGRQGQQRAARAAARARPARRRATSSSPRPRRSCAMAPR